MPEDMTSQNKLLIHGRACDPHHRWGIPCPHCVWSLGQFEDTAEAFFRDGQLECKNCKREVDLWLASERFASVSSPRHMTVSSLGATQTRFEFDLRPFEYKELDLEVFGVPKGATILELVFSPKGKTFPIVAHANSAFIRFMGLKMSIYGAPWDLGIEGGMVTGFTTWIDGVTATQSFLYMVDAMEGIVAKKFRHTVLSAHIAFELEAMALVRFGFERHASKTAVRDFVERELSVSNAVNVVLPQICGAAGIPVIPDHVRGALNELRNLRNKIVHAGLTNDALTENLAARMLFAAMFGFEYIRFARKRLALPRETDSRL